MDEAQKRKYLNNPHITLDEKRKKQLGITTEDIINAQSGPAGPAVELPSERLPIYQEVVRRKKTTDESEDIDHSKQPADRSTL